MDPALIIYTFILNAGGQAKLGQVDAPPVEFAGIKEILDQSLAHERMVTALIYAINDAALAVKDYKTVQFLDWFIQEQVEEEDNASTNTSRFELFGSDPKGLFSLDEELRTRTYTQTTQLALYEGAN